MERDADEERARHARARAAIEGSDDDETELPLLDDTGPDPAENPPVEDV